MYKCHRLALAGCGGMGRRHLRGYRALEDFEPGRIEVVAVIDPEFRSLRRKLELFGSGDFHRLYAFGPHSEIVGRPVASFASSSSSVSVSLDDAPRYQKIDPDGRRLPAYIEGHIAELPEEVAGSPLVLAIAVNGIIRGTTAGTREDGAVHFVTRVPPESFTRGPNRIAVFAVVEENDGQVASLLRFGGP